MYSSEALSEPRQDLEDDIDDFLGDAGEVTGGGSGIRGWNVDIELFEFSGSAPEATLETLQFYLRQRQLPPDTVLVVDGDRRSLYRGTDTPSS